MVLNSESSEISCRCHGFLKEFGKDSIKMAIDYLSWTQICIWQRKAGMAIRTSSEVWEPFHCLLQVGKTEKEREGAKNKRKEKTEGKGDADWHVARDIRYISKWDDNETRSKASLVGGVWAEYGSGWGYWEPGDVTADICQLLSRQSYGLNENDTSLLVLTFSGALNTNSNTQTARSS